MIVTDYFVYIHTSRHAGTFINRLIMENIAGAQMLRYHGQLQDLPTQFKHLPVIGFVRNPWDWYISMYFDYRSKMQYVYEIISDAGRLDRTETIQRFVNLGTKNKLSNDLRTQLAVAAPENLNLRLKMRYIQPGLTKKDFYEYPQDIGYYSWLFKRMHMRNGKLIGYIGRFENLREELIRLFEETGTPISSNMFKYINHQKPVNSSKREGAYTQYYTSKLKEQISMNDQWLIDRYHYRYNVN